MPFYISVPLPGPFRWSHRIGRLHRRHASRFRSPLYWLAGAWAFEAAAWLLWGCLLACLCLPAAACWVLYRAARELWELLAALRR